ncbi:MAG: YaeQ family protein [Chromatiales bacterium]|jgi:uncharacterized protein YaeQ
MALSATVFKAALQIADMDRGYYADHALTVARHPSETDERMMVRLLAFALNASDRLELTPGLCVDDEPALWERSLTGEIDLWVEVGLPEDRRIRKACGRARRVLIYPYGGRQAELWWTRTEAGLRRFPNLVVTALPQPATRALVGLVSRGMQLQCTVQDGQIWLGDGRETVLVEPQAWREATS